MSLLSACTTIITCSTHRAQLIPKIEFPKKIFWLCKVNHIMWKLVLKMVVHCKITQGSPILTTCVINETKPYFSTFLGITPNVETMCGSWSTILYRPSPISSLIPASTYGLAWLLATDLSLSNSLSMFGVQGSCYQRETMLYSTTKGGDTILMISAKHYNLVKCWYPSDPIWTQGPAVQGTGNDICRQWIIFITFFKVFCLQHWMCVCSVRIWVV